MLDSKRDAARQNDVTQRAMEPEAAPRYVALSGLTADQARLLELAGGIRALEWQVYEAMTATDDKSLRESLERFQVTLVRVGEACRVRGWGGKVGP